MPHMKNAPHVTTRRLTRWLCAAVILTIALVGTTDVSRAHHTSTSTLERVHIKEQKNDREIRIPTPDGIELAGNVVFPDQAKFPRPPLVVLPAGYANGESQFLSLCRWLAERGFVSLTYASRGFGKSGGLVDFAGPDTMSDITTVIDWAAEHTPSDTSRVGVYGMSYSGGQVLMAPALDKRIKAVHAISPWGDFERSLYPNNTRLGLVTEAILLTTKMAGRPGPDLQNIEKAYREDTIEQYQSQIQSRSPRTYLHQINNSGAAIQIHHSLQDSVFPPGQTVDFFEDLTVPKRIFFAPGDHGTYSLLPQFGIDDPTWSATLEWFDRYLRNIENNVEHKPTVTSTVMNSSSDEYHGESITTPASWRTMYATQPTWFNGGWIIPAGSLTRTPPSDRWSSTTIGGLPSNTEAGTPYLSTAPAQIAGIPPNQSPNSASRMSTSVFKTTMSTTSELIVGSPQLDLTVKSSSPDFTVTAYLVESDPFGLAGGLISHQVYSVKNLEPGKSQRIHLDFEPTVFRTWPGKVYSLMISTSDGRYLSRTPLGATVTILSGPDDPVKLSFPMSQP